MGSIEDILVNKMRELDVLGDLDTGRLRRMSLAQLLDYLEMHRVQLNVDEIRKDIEEMLGPDLDAIDRMAIDKKARKAFERRVSSTIRRVAVVISNQSLQQYREQAQQDAEDRPAGEQLYQWVWNEEADHCRDCEERQGEVKTMEEWQYIGVPRAGTTQCRGNCKCNLVRYDGPDPRRAKRVRNDEANRGPSAKRRSLFDL